MSKETPKIGSSTMVAIPNRRQGERRGQPTVEIPRSVTDEFRALRPNETIVSYKLTSSQADFISRYAEERNLDLDTAYAECVHDGLEFLQKLYELKGDYK